MVRRRRRTTTEAPDLPRPRADGENPYRRLPEPVRREDLRTSQDVTRHEDEVGEADRERAWLLRTTGFPL